VGQREQATSGLFLQMTKGLSQPGKVLKLKRSLYRLRLSPRNFFLHLKSKLENVGFKSCEDVDPCLFVSDEAIALVYIDDTLQFSPHKEHIDEVLEKLKNEDIKIKVEDSATGFLSVHIKHNKQQGTATLTQKGLIKLIIGALDIADLLPKFTPTEKSALPYNKGGDPPDGTFNCASVIGMLQYLQRHVRPDITFAVSQCACYLHTPQHSHEQAFIRLGQYLKGTAAWGLVLHPSENLSIYCYADADFAGRWPYKTNKTRHVPRVELDSLFVLQIVLLFGPKNFKI
jgi:hypothetical protein